MKLKEFIKAFKKARHKDPDITFWLGENEELELVSLGEFGFCPEVTATFKKIKKKRLK